jgi:hypothetical protein
MKSVFARNDKEIVRVSLAADGGPPSVKQKSATAPGKSVSKVP